LIENPLQGCGSTRGFAHAAASVAESQRVESSITVSELVARLAAEGFRCESDVAPDLRFDGVATDSRKVRPGDLFLALPGSATDGARFIATALDAGAVAAACASDVALEGAPLLRFDDVARAAGCVAAIFHDLPARKLRLVGVTGTNGKTSCTYLFESVWRAAGLRPGVLGTVSQRWAGVERQASMTTPPVVELQSALAEMVSAGCDWVAMEVSSHALAQHRVSGCAFDAAVFTNLTRDHLDYHGDEESYFAAKASLFRDYLKHGGIPVINADDPWASRLAELVGSRDVWTYATDGAAARVEVVEAHMDLDGIQARVRVDDDVLDVRAQLVGAPNLSNILAVLATTAALGVDRRAIAAGVAACAPVPGRLERVGRALPVVLVDYAHTPDALERTLRTVRPHVRGRLICVFGCGGDRDRGKRPMMGAIAGREAHVSVITSDNPRSEEPAAIVAEIESGIRAHADRRAFLELSHTRERGYLVEVDRQRAIELALETASDDDVVVIAGKGHEDYQEIRGERRPFDDRAVARRLLGGA
jgi:UDP-N-acetylmuramoyl-L-alanyl-D-glutamate--2,6-diaminopimelate ligase